jgi:hypothetical protein
MDLLNAQGCPKQVTELLLLHRLLAWTTMRTALLKYTEETGFASILRRSSQADSIQTCALIEQRGSRASYSTWIRSPQVQRSPPRSRTVMEARILP